MLLWQTKFAELSMKFDEAQAAAEARVEDIKQTELLRRELLRETTTEMMKSVSPTSNERLNLSPAAQALQWERDANKTEGETVTSPIDEELLEVRDRYVSAPRPYQVYDAFGGLNQSKAEELPPQAPAAPSSSVPDGQAHWAPAW